jgi:DNA adenine methylase
MTVTSEKKHGPPPHQKSLADFSSIKFSEDQGTFLEKKRAQNKKAKSIVDVPRPVMKWAGGKRQLLEQLDSYIPKTFNKYIEPFVGGGAMFFYLLPEKAILIDINPDLINIYTVIKNNVQELIESLLQHKNDSEYYYTIRDVDRDKEVFSKWSDVEKASRNIYMNHTCFNGLYRVNSKGFFNVPFGDYKNPLICDEENLLAVHEALENVELHVGSFEMCLDFAETGDFIYFDPPYVPVSQSANFTSYTKENFGRNDQYKLFEVFKELDARGCKMLLSNSHSEFIIDLFKEYRVETLMANRAINSDGSKRGKIKEVLILNNFE